MSYFDDELEQELSNLNINFKKLEKEIHDNLVTEINEKLPFAGSKIAWSVLTNSINFNNYGKTKAFQLVTEKLKNVNATEIFFIGDSLTENAYQIDIKNLESSLKVFAEIPQHTYFFPKNLSWIGCTSAEGDIDLSII